MRSKKTISLLDEEDDDDDVSKKIIPGRVAYYSLFHKFTHSIIH